MSAEEDVITAVTIVAFWRCGVHVLRMDLYRKTTAFLASQVAYDKELNRHSVHRILAKFMKRIQFYDMLNDEKEAAEKVKIAVLSLITLAQAEKTKVCDLFDKKRKWLSLRKQIDTAQIDVLEKFSPRIKEPVTVLSKTEQIAELYLSMQSRSSSASTSATSMRTHSQECHSSSKLSIVDDKDAESDSQTSRRDSQSH